MPHSHPNQVSGFLGQFEHLFGFVRDRFERLQNPGRGPNPKLPAWDLLASLVYHVISDAGHFSAHVFQLFEVVIKDSSPHSFINRGKNPKKIVAGAFGIMLIWNLPKHQTLQPKSHLQ